MAIKIMMAVFCAIALYNAVELVILIFLTFTRYSGLYFWAMLLSAVLGVIPQAIGFLLEFFAIGPLWFAVTFSTIGFYFMVPGQSIVLYSRLHLVVQSQTLLRRVLYLIIFDTIVLLIPTTVPHLLHDLCPHHARDSGVQCDGANAAGLVLRTGNSHLAHLHRRDFEAATFAARKGR